LGQVKRGGFSIKFNPLIGLEGSFPRDFLPRAFAEYGIRLIVNCDYLPPRGPVGKLQPSHSGFLERRVGPQRSGEASVHTWLNSNKGT
jgi:hypothetical protein